MCSVACNLACWRPEKNFHSASLYCAGTTVWSFSTFQPGRWGTRWRRLSPPCHYAIHRIERLYTCGGQKWFADWRSVFKGDASFSLVHNRGRISPTLRCDCCCRERSGRLGEGEVAIPRSPLKPLRTACGGHGSTLCITFGVVVCTTGSKSRVFVYAVALRKS